MTLEILDTSRADVAAFEGKAVAVIGYGNQGHAHALNLRDSGVRVVVGQRRGGGFDRATADGFAPVPIREAVAAAELIIMTLPDESASGVYEAEILPALSPGRTLGFVHGFNVRYGLIDPPGDINCVMVAPKGPGTLLRRLYREGVGLPALLAVHHDATGAAESVAMAWAYGIGATRAAVARTTFAQETEADLFGEQAVLCGGVTALVSAAFDTLVEAGFDPDIAYLECVHELKQVVDLIYRYGIVGMRRRISNTAEFGDVSRGPRVVDEEVKTVMRSLLAEVRSGAFAREWMDEYRQDMPTLREAARAMAESPIEQAGRRVRRMMPWLADSDGRSSGGDSSDGGSRPAQELDQ